MIRISGAHLTSDDRLFLRYATKYTLGYLLPHGQHKKASILIRVGEPGKDEDGDNRGSCDMVMRKGRKTCFIWLLDKLVNWRSDHPMGRFKNLMECLFHELVHVRQYLSGELENRTEQTYCWRGRVLYEPETRDEYYESPPEMEAYGRTQHLTERFTEHWVKLNEQE